MDHALISHHVVHDTISISNTKQKTLSTFSSMYFAIAVDGDSSSNMLAFSMSGQKLMRTFLININRNEKDFDVLFTVNAKIYLFSTKFTSSSVDGDDGIDDTCVLWLLSNKCVGVFVQVRVVCCRRFI